VIYRLLCVVLLVVSTVGLATTDRPAFLFALIIAIYALGVSFTRRPA